MVEFAFFIANCSFSSVRLDDVNSSSRLIMRRPIELLGFTCFALLIVGAFVYMTTCFCDISTLTRRHWFEMHGRLILGMFYGIFTFISATNSYICRPARFFYEHSFISGFVMHGTGFLVCIHYTYLFGRILIVQAHRQASCEVFPDNINCVS